VHAAVTAHLSGAAPENMFAPFTISTLDEDGQPKRSRAPVVHWGNVDTGAQVNITYSGVLDAYPELLQFRREFTHVVQGVGNKRTAVVCKLADVPLSLGPDQHAGNCIRTTFYVLECPSYHFILGLQLLESIEAGVFCSTRDMTFRLGTAGKKQVHRVPLIPRSQVQSTPAYLAVASRQRQPAHVLEAIPEGWEHGLKGEEGVDYVGEVLLDVLGMAGLNGEDGQGGHLHPLPDFTPLVDPVGAFTGPPARPTSGHVETCSTPAGAPLGEPHEPAPPPTAIAEQAAAATSMQSDFSLPSWDDRGPPRAGTPRCLRKAVACEATRVDTSP
jgi:hypothetical protein